MAKTTGTKRLGPRERMLFARRIRQLYIFERNAWEAMRLGEGAKPDFQPGPRWDGGGRRKGIWKSVADYFIQHGIGGHAYIFYVFWQIDFFNTAPMPTHLCSPKWLEGFRGDLENQIDKFANSFEPAVRELLGRLASNTETIKEFFPDIDPANIEEKAAKMALLDRSESGNMSALFKIRAAHEWGFKDFVSELLNDAAVDYSRKKDLYDTAWPSFPSNLKAAMAKRMELILQP